MSPNRRLKELEEKIERLEKDFIQRERFVAALAHDVINPLASIQTAVEMMEAQPECVESELCRMGVDIIKKSSKLADRLVRSFLDVKSVSAGRRLPANFRHGDFKTHIENVLYLFNKKNIKLICKHQKIEGIWDHDLLERALGNLITNALKHGDGNKCVRVGCKTDGKEMWIRVHNWGNPIPKSCLRDIFEPFNPSVDDKYGWGLGLSFVKLVADIHSGSLNVKSTHCHGTLFNMRIPVNPLK